MKKEKKCWWIFFHDWEFLGEWEDVMGEWGDIWQEKKCKKCKKSKILYSSPPQCKWGE